MMPRKILLEKADEPGTLANKLFCALHKPISLPTIPPTGWSPDMHEVIMPQSVRDTLAAQNTKARRQMVLVVRHMSCELEQHLYMMPKGIELVWALAGITETKTCKANRETYLTDRRNFVSWLGHRVSETCPTLTVPENTSCRFAKTFFATQPLAATALEGLKRGLTPQGWSIEHIHPLGLACDQDHNRIGNLQLMPNEINQWTGRLVDMQLRSPASKLILAARPILGPAQGHFIFGASHPVSEDRGQIERWQNLHIRSLRPEKICDAAARPVTTAQNNLRL